MRRAFIALLMGLAIGTPTACCRPTMTQRLARVEIPDVSIAYVDTLDDNSADGEVYCTQAGVPAIHIRKSLGPTEKVWVELHERTHIAQMVMSKLTCFGWAKKYTFNDQFMLQKEAEAYCAVWDTQMLFHFKPSPTIDEIVLLLFEYNEQWSTKQVTGAMPCWSDDE